MWYSTADLGRMLEGARTHTGSMLTAGPSEFLRVIKGDEGRGNSLRTRVRVMTRT